MTRFLNHVAILGTVMLFFGCDLPKPQKKSSATTPESTNTTEVKTNQANANPNPQPAPNPGGGVQTPRTAAARTVTRNDLHNIHIYITNASLASGQMPSVNETYQALKKEAPKIAQLIDEKVITLHAATNREQVWAYETAALTNGGLVCTASGVEQMDANTLKQRLR